MPVIKITSESISAALTIDWKLANDGTLAWTQIMGFITIMQKFYLYSGGDLSAPEYQDLHFLRDHALSRVYE